MSTRVAESVGKDIIISKSSRPKFMSLVVAATTSCAAASALMFNVMGTNETPGSQLPLAAGAWVGACVGACARRSEYV